jgi:hypothetical protein
MIVRHYGDFPPRVGDELAAGPHERAGVPERIDLFFRVESVLRTQEMPESKHGVFESEVTVCIMYNRIYAFR